MRNTPFRCDIKDAGVPGLRIALRSMRVGEECQVRVTPEYGYGDVGCGNRIPPSAVLYFELTLLEYVETHDDGAMSSEECSKLPFSKLFKVCCLKYRDANRFLAAKNYVAADRGYADAAKLLESALEPPDDEQRNQRRGLLKLYTNWRIAD
ncbi:inactive peptidyl-prolyl cis-trans isomerase FKBP6 [Rhipicephalus sanguineus]|uniref:inactive peptidyl-prolyl cis-trans isomerase FKBP6 n=1 Tax=Rhipicephalus sanguineus TaxID=34632 RepID=UPI0020C3127C|nr:inactive peptidyl-prolyl cis-trans isomerase FKBP6 [Rhipicephalus sanguineus]